MIVTAILIRIARQIFFIPADEIEEAAKISKGKSPSVGKKAL